MLYAAIHIHKHALQATVLDPEKAAEVVEERFSADRESLAHGASGGEARPRG